MQIGTDPLSKLRGQIERITFANEENGFTIAKMKVKGEKELVTVVGNFLGINPGEVLELSGGWSNHPKFGDQFKAEKFKSVIPASAAGVEKFLGSGLIRSIGPIMASRPVKHFGENTLEIIDTNPERLGEVEGIGKKRGQMIRSAWEAQKEIREVRVFPSGTRSRLGLCCEDLWIISNLVGCSERSSRCPGERAGAEDKKDREQPFYVHPAFSPQRDAGVKGSPG